MASKLVPLMPDLAGAVPHSRFTILSNKTVLFLADFDGEPGKLRRGQYVRS